MKLTEDSPHQASGFGQAVRADRYRPWSLLLAVGVAGLLVHLPVQAKPIAGCLVQDAEMLDPTACLLPPKSLAATRPTSQTIAITEGDKVERLTLDNVESKSGAVASVNTGPSSGAECSALRGTHEAQSLMLQTMQQQLSAIELDRRSAQSRLNALRGRGAGEAHLSSAATQLTKINAVWSVLKGDVEKRTKNFNNSMSRLTKACLRG